MKTETVLAVDVGNSRVKWALARAGGLSAGEPFCSRAELLEDELDRHWGALPAPERVVVSSVKGPESNATLTAWLLDRWHLPARFATVNAESLGVRNGYENPLALGIDRWVAMIAAWNSCRGPLCVADCGTALTLDAVDAEGRHLGGSIAPGLSLMRQSLESGAPALHRLPSGKPDIPARNTADAVQSGILQMAAGFIDRFVTKIEARVNSPVQLFLTGGDAPTVAAQLETPFKLEPDLILHGLLLIAEGDS